MKERILQLIKALGISGREFSRSIGKSESFARTITGNVGTDVLVEIIRVYPNVNLYWLVTGEGRELKDDTATKQNESSSSHEHPDRDALLSQLIKENGDLREQIGMLKRDLESAKQGKRIYTSDVTLRTVAESEVEYKKKDK